MRTGFPAYKTSARPSSAFCLLTFVLISRPLRYAAMLFKLEIPSTTDFNFPTKIAVKTSNVHGDPSGASSSSIFSARCLILNILPTMGAKLLCHWMSCFLSKSIPSSISIAAILAALKQIEVMDCNPEHLWYSSTPLKDTSEPYSSAISLKPLLK